MTHTDGSIISRAKTSSGLIKDSLIFLVMILAGVYWGDFAMSTTCEKYSYKFFTDRWMFIVVLWFYFVIRYQLMPGFITDVYLPFVLCFAKFIWTKTSYLKIYDDQIEYRHKELPTYVASIIYASKIKRVYFKVLFFTMIDKQYCLVEYEDKKNKIKSLLLNMERFPNSDRVRASLIAFCKRNDIEIIY